MMASSCRLVSGRGGVLPAQAREFLVAEGTHGAAPVAPAKGESGWLNAVTFIFCY